MKKSLPTGMEGGKPQGGDNGLSFEGTELREQDKALGVNTRGRDLYLEQSFLVEQGEGR